METHLDKKFYVPSIEEFFVGFEFEHKDPCYDGREEFQKAIVESDALVRYPNEEGVFNYWEAEHLLSNILYDIKENNIRVKYLDQNDIEELGFMFEEQVVGKITFKYTKNNFIELHKLYTTILILNNGRTIFEGFIKNKSELIRLLGWLNV